MNDDRFKALMGSVGMPDSHSLLVALKQVANEVAQEQAAEIERLEDALAGKAGEDLAGWDRTAFEAIIRSHQRNCDRLRAALQHLAEGSTPWIDGYHEKSWEVMAAYAKATLEAKL